jgi:hypothetical protein
MSSTLSGKVGYSDSAVRTEVRIQATEKAKKANRLANRDCVCKCPFHGHGFNNRLASACPDLLERPKHGCLRQLLNTARRVLVNYAVSARATTRVFLQQ